MMMENSAFIHSSIIYVNTQSKIDIHICVWFSVLLLLAVAVRSCTRRGVKKGGGLLIGESDDDVRDNVFNYDEQGGGEEDEVRVNKRCKIPQTRSLHYGSGLLHDDI